MSAIRARINFTTQTEHHYYTSRHMIDQSRHSGMHETDTVDVICLLKGRGKTILEDAETELVPGNVVIQRGTNHAWTAIDGTANLAC